MLAHLQRLLIWTVCKPRNVILREAGQDISSHYVKTWPKSILRFEGFPDSPAFEDCRDELSYLEEDRCLRILYIK